MIASNIDIIKNKVKMVYLLLEYFKSLLQNNQIPRRIINNPFLLLF